MLGYILLGLVLVYVIFINTPVGEKFKTYVSSNVNDWFNNNIDPIKSLQLKIDNNIKLIKQLGKQYADIRADIDITSPKVDAIKAELKALNKQLKTAVEEKDETTGLSLISLIESTTKFKDALVKQLEKLRTVEAKLVKIKTILKRRNDLAKTNISLLKTRKSSSSNLKDISENIVDIDLDNSDIMDDIEKGILSDEYLTSDNLATLSEDTVDEASKSKWEELIK